MEEFRMENLELRIPDNRSSILNSKFSILNSPFRWRRPKTIAAIMLLLLVTGAGGANVWAEYHRRAAVRCVREDRLEEADQHIQLCLHVWPFRSEVQFLAARIARLNGDYERTEAHLNEYKRIRKEPTEEFQLEWRLLLAQRGELSSEVEFGLLNCVHEDHPETPLILEALARGYMRDMRLRSALACLNQWLEREPDTVRALDWRGWVNEKLNNHRAAIEDYRHCLQLDPDRTDVRIRLASRLLEDANPLEALPHLERMRQSHPERVEATVGLARCRHLEGRIGEARDLLDEVLATHPDDASALLCRGKLAMEEKRPADAESDFRRILNAEPYALEAIYLLAQSLEQQGNHDREVGDLITRHKELEVNMKRIGELLSGGAAERDRCDATAASELGIRLLRVGQEKLGVRWLRTALDRDPTHQASLEALANYLDRRGQLNEAAGELRIENEK
jgi:tetratricopeptide (TPR) repeat protein